RAVARSWQGLGLDCDGPPLATGVHGLLAPRVDVGADAGEVAHQLGAEAGREATGRRRDGAGFDRPTFRLPLREASVEDGDPVVTEHAEGPPHAGGSDQILLAVDHDATALGQPDGPTPRRERTGASA